MEESLKLLNESLETKIIAADSYSPLNLAYIGDAVYEVYIRTMIIKKGNVPVNKLHKTAISYVSAKAQAEIIDKIFDKLTEKEVKIFKRGRNSKPNSMAKNASVSEYLKATGFEALVGYLYLNKEYDRLIELIDMGINK